MLYYKSALTLIVAATMISSSALACSCARRPTAEKILTQAPAVFTGNVLSSKSLTPGAVITTFEIIESFKGVKRGQIVRVHHKIGIPASCAVNFEIGKQYTLSTQAFALEPGLSTSRCLTWMFEPNISTRKETIMKMRELRQ